MRSKNAISEGTVASATLRFGVQDAPPSNRASETCIRDPSFQLLRQAIDSLEVSFRGELRLQSEIDLRERKTIAQLPEARHQANAQIVVNEEVFCVGDKGAGMYPFVISDNRFRIKLGRGRSMPVALVQIRSDFLAHVGPEAALVEAAAVVGQLADITGLETVSRIDLAVDFYSSQDMEGWPRLAWVTRAKKKDSHAIGDRFTGWSIGLSADLSARLYDKVFEIQTQSHKTYLFDLWRNAGWFSMDPVWRIEFQIRRPILARYRIRTLADLTKQLDGLWSYLTSDWLRLTVPNLQDETRSRWITHPLWGSLQAVQWEGSTAPLIADCPEAGVPSNRYLAIRGGSALISLMAREGIFDLDKGWCWLRNIFECHWQDKAMWESAPFEELISEKIREKGRKYGTINNVIAIQGRDAGADEEVEAEERAEAAARYRKASRG